MYSKLTADEHVHYINPRLMQHHKHNLRNLKFSENLYAHLLINDLLQAFSDLLQNHVEHEHINYQHPCLNLAINIGHQQRHYSDYQLSIDGLNIGNLSITRRHAFSQEDLTDLETFVSCLVSPLRNSLSYQQALNHASTDALTGLANRCYLQTTLQQEWKHSMRQESALSLMLIDIDRFKYINDRYGHLSGDIILTEVASLISHCSREDDMIYRYGGDEFLLLLRNTDSQGAQQLGTRIHHTIESHDFHHKHKKLHTTVSLGLSSLQPSTHENIEHLLEQADQALYQAKALGGNHLISL